jgi:hypothetical protein
MTESQSKALHERLLNAGLGAAEAEEIVKSQQSITENTETVDVDRLTVAMEGIKKAFEADSEPEEEGEEVMPDTGDAIQEATNIVDAVTKGADALLAEQRTQFEALSKALILLTEEVTELRSTVSNGSEVVQKSLTTAQAALNEPIMRKSIDSLEAVPTPGETAESNQVVLPDLIAKALSEIQIATTPDNRKAELRKAITLLESGMPAAHVANTYSLVAQ